MRPQGLFEKISSYSSTKIFFSIFIVSFFTRGLLSFLFAFQYGMHAVPFAETYFYYGVLKGTYSLTSWDITSWLFSLTRLIVPPEYLYQAVIFEGCFFSSLTSSLVFLLARELHDKKVGVICGFLYSFMVEPLTMGILLFTHDLIQLPVFVLSLFFALLAAKEKRLYLKVIYVFSLSFCLCMGWAISAVIFVAIEIILLYYLLLLAEYGARRFGVEYDIRPYFLGGIILFSLPLRFMNFLTVPTIISFISALFPTHSYGELLAVFKAGSPDFVPVGFDALWTRYNVFILILPFSAYRTFKKKDYFSLLFLFIAIFNTTFFDRGTRIMDVAFALIIAHAFYEWESRWTVYAYLILFSAFVVAIVFLLGTPFSIILFSAFFLPLLLFFGFVYYSEKRNVGYSALLLIFIFNIPFTYALLTLFPPQITEAEWSAASSIPRDSGKILVPWGQGFFFEATSGHPSQSNPGKIDYFFYEALMMNEEKAYSALMQANVSYLVISDREFKFYVNTKTNKMATAIHPYFLNFLPQDAKIDYVKNTLIYKMLYESASLKYFRIIYETKDKATGMTVKIFVPQKTQSF